MFIVTNYIISIISLILVLFLPGYLLIKIVAPKDFHLGEVFIISISLSISIQELVVSVFSVFPIWTQKNCFILNISLVIILLTLYYKFYFNSKNTLLKNEFEIDRVSLFLLILPSFFVMMLIVNNLLSYPYYNAADPWLNQIYFREITSGKFTLFYNLSNDPYVKTESEIGFHFFLTYLSTISNIPIHLLTRFGGPICFLLFSSSLSFIIYRINKFSIISAITAFVLTTSPYITYRFLMLIPEQFCFILFSSLLIMMIAKKPWTKFPFIIINATLFAAIFKTHILISFFIFLLISAFFIYGLITGKTSESQYLYNLLVAFFLGLSISPRFPSLFMSTFLYESYHSYLLPVSSIYSYWSAIYKEYPYIIDVILHTFSISITLLLLKYKENLTGKITNIIQKSQLRIKKISILIIFIILILDLAYQIKLNQTQSYEFTMNVNSFNVVSIITCFFGGFYYFHNDKNDWHKLFLKAFILAFLLMLLFTCMPLGSIRFPQIVFTNRLIPYVIIIITIFSVIMLESIKNKLNKTFKSKNLEIKNVIRHILCGLLCFYFMFSSISDVSNTKGWSRWYQNDVDAAQYLKSVITPIQEDSIILPQWDDQLLLSYVGISSNLYCYNTSQLVNIISSRSFPSFISTVKNNYPDKKTIFIFETEIDTPFIENISLPTYLRNWKIKSFLDTNIYMINITYP